MLFGAVQIAKYVKIYHFSEAHSLIISLRLTLLPSTSRFIISLRLTLALKFLYVNMHLNHDNLWQCLLQDYVVLCLELSFHWLTAVHLKFSCLSQLLLIARLILNPKPRSLIVFVESRLTPDAQYNSETETFDHTIVLLLVNLNSTRLDHSWILVSITKFYFFQI